jgi:hypothetical protein
MVEGDAGAHRADEAGRRARRPGRRLDSQCSVWRLERRHAGGLLIGRGPGGGRLAGCAGTPAIVASRRPPRASSRGCELFRRSVRIVLLVALFAATVLALSPGGRLTAEALALLADVWLVARDGGGDGAAAPASHSYPGPGGSARIADLYCDPRQAPGGRLLLVHGLVDTGKDDRRLRNLGAALARHRFQVMIPDFPGMRALRAGREDIDEVAAALAALAAAPHCAAAGGATDLPIGVIGFSYSAGPVLLALDRSPAPAGYAVLFGGYYDLADVILFLTTGVHRLDGERLEGEYLLVGRWGLLEANAEAIADPGDRALLVEIARRRRRDSGAPIADLVVSLGPAGRAAYDLTINTDPERFAALLGRCDPGLQSMIADLSPSRRLSGPLPIDLYLLHGRGDVVIPYTQSVEIAARVAVTGRRRLALLGGFRHARPEERSDGRPWWSTALRNPGDSLRLLGVLNEVLGHRAPLRGAARPVDRGRGGSG